MGFRGLYGLGFWSLGVQGCGVSAVGVEDLRKWGGVGKVVHKWWLPLDFYTGLQGLYCILKGLVGVFTGA